LAKNPDSPKSGSRFFSEIPIRRNRDPDFGEEIPWSNTKLTPEIPIRRHRDPDFGDEIPIRRNRDPDFGEARSHSSDVFKRNGISKYNKIFYPQP
jgi:hypothetical protein